VLPEGVVRRPVGGVEGAARGGDRAVHVWRVAVGGRAEDLSVAGFTFGKLAPFDAATSLPSMKLRVSGSCRESPMHVRAA
jgi:hypothetical protein